MTQISQIGFGFSFAIHCGNSNAIRNRKGRRRTQRNEGESNFKKLFRFVSFVYDFFRRVVVSSWFSSATICEICGLVVMSAAFGMVELRLVYLRFLVVVNLRCACLGHGSENAFRWRRL